MYSLQIYNIVLTCVVYKWKYKWTNNDFLFSIVVTICQQLKFEENQWDVTITSKW